VSILKFTIDVLLDEHNKVQCAPTGDPTCKHKKVVVALMFWLDATHLATFGTAKMWPIYMLFSNLSKYTQSQPTSSATKHLAYIQLLKKLSQYFAILERLTWYKSNKLSNILEIIYVIV
jgi:hypothetical protein